MRKTTLLLFGLFTLFACSEDDVQDMDNQISEDAQGVDPPTVPVVVADEYYSPYDSTIAGSPIQYFIHNNSPLIIELTPMIGLAYFDGMDNGLYNHSSFSSPIDLSNGDYPNLYNRGTEYLNLIQGEPILVGANGHLSGAPFHHCPLINMGGVYFDISTSGATSEESALLQDFGKVYYYRFKLIDPSNNLYFNTPGSEGELRLQFKQTNPKTPWIDLNVSSIFSDNYFYNNSSLEIVADSSNTPSETYFNYIGVDYTIKYFSEAGAVFFTIEP